MEEIFDFLAKDAVRISQALSEIGCTFEASSVLTCVKAEAAATSKRNVLCDILKQISFERLHCGPWKDVDTVWRDLYSFSSVLMVLCNTTATTSSAGSRLEELKQALRLVDLALLMGSSEYHEVEHELSELLCERIRALDEENGRAAAAQVVLFPPSESDSNSSPHALESCCEIARVQSPTLHQFAQNYLKSGTPVIVTGAMSHWPALQQERSWRNIGYLRSIAGARTVPVEVGEHYMAHDWSQQLMTLDEFFDRYILSPTNAAVGYVAQTRLFEHIPRLMSDIAIPDYCALGGIHGIDDFGEQLEPDVSPYL